MILGYLDPVTGNALIQIGLAAMAAIGLGWQYVRKAFRGVALAIRSKMGQSEYHRQSDDDVPTPPRTR